MPQHKQLSPNEIIKMLQGDPALSPAQSADAIIAELMRSTEFDKDALKKIAGGHQQAELVKHSFAIDPATLPPALSFDNASIQSMISPNIQRQMQFAGQQTPSFSPSSGNPQISAEKLFQMQQQPQKIASGSKSGGASPTPLPQEA